MEVITIILQSTPYGDERIWNALRLAKALYTASVGMNVRISLLGDAADNSLKGTKVFAKLLQLGGEASRTNWTGHQSCKL